MRAKTRWFSTVALGAAILLAAPGAAEWWDWAAPRVDASLVVERDRDDRDRNREDAVPRRERERDRDRDRGRSARRGGAPRGNQAEMPAFCRTGEGHPVFGMSWCHGNRSGPAFCRTGEGHPVFGMRWCFEKGFVPGSARWRPSDLGDIVFDPRPRRRADRGTFGERVLEDILGDIIFGRLVSHRGTLGIDENLEGRWHVPLERDSARVLQVRSGGLPIAELSDLDGDGRVEVTLVLEP